MKFEVNKNNSLDVLSTEGPLSSTSCHGQICIAHKFWACSLCQPKEVYKCKPSIAIVSVLCPFYSSTSYSTFILKEVQMSRSSFLSSSSHAHQTFKRTCWRVNEIIDHWEFSSSDSLKSSFFKKAYFIFSLWILKGLWENVCRDI